MSVLRIALPVPMRRVFDYLGDNAEVGCRVEVEFGRRKLVGLVVELATESSIERDKLKPIVQVLDSEPVLESSLLQLGHWLADYHHHPIGDVLMTLLPASLRKAVPIPTLERELLCLTEAGEAQLSLPMRAKQQLGVLSMLSNGALLPSEVKQSFSQAVIKACLQKRWITSYTETLEPRRDWHINLQIGASPRPTTEQALAISTIQAVNEQYSPFLLEGVTGSGKTEVYLQVIAPILERGQQVLVLVPEIGLTPQTIQRFERRFGITVGALHSGLTDNERLAVWQGADNGSIGLVIGTRSSVFTQFHNLGMIIVDEEHDESYKQQDSLRYHARDVAVLRAKAANIPLIMGSATPSFESLNNALTGKYRLLRLLQRTGSAQMASQQILDIRNQTLEAGVSQDMLAKMQQHLSAGGQVLVFVNRRGYAPAIVCHQCGHVEECHRCDAPYTVHKAVQRLHCHRCDATKAIPHHCPKCGSRDLIHQGVGTEQLENYFNSVFVNHSTVRIDSDSVRGKRKLNQMIEAINHNQHQILIGTQILSKGHHFPLVTLVVVLDVDAALFSADVRATEKLAQLLTQVAGRAGRENRQGEMWLQTHHPDHPLLQDLLNNGYDHFARYALAERKAADAPPYVHQTVFRAEANNMEHAERFLSTVRHALERQPSLTLIGPLPATVFKRADRYRMMLIVQSKVRKILHDSVESQLQYIEGLPDANRVRWAIDVAPTDMS